MSTRVVSWKEAAEMKLRVCKLALVIPSSTGWVIAGRPPRASVLGAFFVHFDLVEVVALQQAGVAGFEDLHLLQHLADDGLDVLVD